MNIDDNTRQSNDPQQIFEAGMESQKNCDKPYREWQDERIKTLEKQLKDTNALASLLPAAVKALEWYAENARLCRLIHSEGDTGRNALAKDGGNLAKSTLKAIAEVNQVVREKAA